MTNKLEFAVGAHKNLLTISDNFPHLKQQFTKGNLQSELCLKRNVEMNFPKNSPAAGIFSNDIDSGTRSDGRICSGLELGRV